jgi:hypothetical protein
MTMCCTNGSGPVHNPEKEWCSTAMLELSQALEQTGFTIVEKHDKCIEHHQYDGVEHWSKYTLQDKAKRVLHNSIHWYCQDQGSEFDSIFLKY